MRIYLAADYYRRGELRAYREQLEQYGHAVTSRWLDTNASSADLTEVQRARIAGECVYDIMNSDMLVCYTDEWRRHNHGGRHVELGLAIGLQRRVLVVGAPENVFHSHLAVQRVPDWAAAYAVLCPHKE